MAALSWEDWQKQNPAPYDLQKFVEDSNAKYAGMQYADRPQEFHDEYAKQLDANKQWQAAYFNQVGDAGGSIPQEARTTNDYVNVWNGAAGQYMSREDADVYGQGPNADPTIVPGGTPTGQNLTQNPITGNYGGTNPPSGTGTGGTSGTSGTQTGYTPPVAPTGSGQVAVPEFNAYATTNTSQQTQTGTGTAPTAPTGSAAPTGVASQNISPTLTPTDMGPAAFKVGNASVSVVTQAPDGSIQWVTYDPTTGYKYETLNKEQFAAKYGEAAAAQYYNKDGLLPAVGQYKVDTYGANNFQAGGNTFTILSKNPDGTISWSGTDGKPFATLNAYDFARYFGREAANKYYGTQQTNVGTTQTSPLHGDQFVARTVDPAKETVQGQLQSILAADSTYLQRARASVDERMNARGLMNSTLAGQAGEAAAIDAALPIASADAAIYGRASDYNADIQNQMKKMHLGSELSVWEAGQKNLLTQDNMHLGSELSVWEAGQKNLLTQDNMKLGSELSVWEAGQKNLLTQDNMKLQQQINESSQRLAAQLNVDSQKTLLALTHNYNQLKGASAAASNFMAQVQAQISTILASPDITAENKDVMIGKVTEFADAFLVSIGSFYGVDFSVGDEDVTNKKWTGGDFGGLVTNTQKTSFEAGGNTFSIATRNADGTISWTRSDGQKFDNMTRDGFAKFFGDGLADYYY